MKKPKLTQEDYNQALDYAYVLGASYCTMLDKCDVVHKNKAAKAAFEKVTDALHNLYGTIGQESVK